jgi:hypothetical protein
MTEKDPFNDPLKIFDRGTRKPVRDSVIKQNSVKVGNPKRIDQKEEPALPGGEPAIQPIMEEGQIVGIIYECTCGKISEVRFDFE